MKILVINAGSSSLKYQLIDMDNESVIAKGNCERIGMDGHITHKTFDDRQVSVDCAFPTHTEAFEKVVEVLTSGEASVIKSMDEIAAVGHRIVQGAEIFNKATIVTDEVIDQIDGLSELAPVHNHPHALALRACKKVIPANVPQVVVFDTAFHQTMPEKAFMFGLPYECYEKYHVRKYGFHGTSHRFVSRALADAMGKKVEDLKIISCHLGNGSSITAVDGGKSVDTSMGFTPLDGVIMGTRCGAIDASAVTFVQKKLGLDPSEMSDYLNKKSGFLGVSGVSSDNRDVDAAAAQGNKRAILAGEILRYGIKKYIGSYAAVMNGVDAIIFTGGIGENAPSVRADACHDMEFFGIKLDDNKNAEAKGVLSKISAPNSKVEVWVVPTNEELLIARDTKELCGL
ncbi:MAG: acetate kinase [Oscillospiraceae bacterium]|nr:acetate kinase [Oscillospiraceae bacterium]